MEEDILYGKKRHLFGGLEPSNMKSLKFIAYDENVRLNVTLPEDTVVDGQVLCSVDGAMIRRKTDGYPKDEFDGVLVADVKVNGVYIDGDSSTGETYYYAAFPYTDQGVFNRSDLNRAKYNPSMVYYTFGYDLDTTDPDPSTRVSYPSDVDNYGFEPARMNFDTDIFDYGDWNVSPGLAFMPKPCMLRNDGTVDHYLNPNNYTLREDGITPSSVADGTFDGHAMMEWPKIYTKRWEENGFYHFRCSSVKHDDTWDCWCNYDSKNNETEHFYTSIYTVSDSMKSVSGVASKIVAPKTDDSVYSGMTTTSTNIKNMGNGWNMEVYADRLLIQDLLIMMACDTDCQTSYGFGKNPVSTTGADNVLPNGTLDTRGMFWGSTDESDAVKVFGMENWWGNLGRFIYGFYNSTSYGYTAIKITAGTHDGTTISGYYTESAKFDRADIDEYLLVGSSGADGYIKTFTVKSYGRIPGSVGGSATTYEADYAKHYSGYTYHMGIIGVAVSISTRNDKIIAVSCEDIGPFSVTFGSNAHSMVALSFKPQTN